MDLKAKFYKTFFSNRCPKVGWNRVLDRKMTSAGG